MDAACGREARLLASIGEDARGRHHTRAPDSSAPDTSTPDTGAGGPVRVGVEHAARALAGVALVLALLASLALPAPLRAQEAPDAGAVIVRSHVERPPEGSLRRGSLDVPGWVVLLGGGAVAALAAGALAYRLGRRRR